MQWLEIVIIRTTDISYLCTKKKNIKNTVNSFEPAKTQVQKVGLSDVIFPKISSQTNPVLFIPKRLYLISELLKTSNKKVSRNYVRFFFSDHNLSLISCGWTVWHE